jgi:hypothetical protein
MFCHGVDVSLHVLSNMHIRSNTRALQRVQEDQDPLKTSADLLDAHVAIIKKLDDAEDRYNVILARFPGGPPNALLSRSLVPFTESGRRKRSIESLDSDSSSEVWPYPH